MAKLYGAGGLQGLEAYQSGFLISPQGHILTAWTYVLDTDSITAVSARFPSLPTRFMVPPTTIWGV
jgi:hypothetical protein